MNHLWLKRRASLLLALLTLALLLPGAALAHERRTIGNGKYDVVVGWDVEPAIAGEKNGAGIRISQANTNPAQPITGAEQTLKVQIRQGAATKEFPLRAVFGQPGYYVADIVPTRDGDYQWTFVGTINGDQVNDKFDTADGKFNKVEPVGDLQFPVASGDPAQVAATARDAQAAVGSVRTLAYVGIGAGVLGLLVALASLALRTRGAASVGAQHAVRRGI